MSLTEAITVNNLDEDSSIITPTHAAFKYYGDPGKVKYDQNRSIHLDEHNFVAEWKMPLTDIRQNISHYNIDVHGFEIVNRTPLRSPSVSDLSAHSDNASDKDSTSSPWWSSKETVYSKYYPDITALLQERLDIKSVLWKDYLIRDECEDEFTDKHATVKKRRGPITRPHVDWSSKGTRSMLRNVLPTFYTDTGRDFCTPQHQINEWFEYRQAVIEAEDRCAEAAGVSTEEWDGSNYDGPRWAMINVWQPLEGPVKRDPLAWVDARTIKPEEDYEGVPRWYKLYKGFKEGFKAENWVLRPPPAEQPGETGQDRHHWHWLSGQKASEVTLIKIFDSESLKSGSTTSGGCPHSAFTVPGTQSLPPRKSIEVKGFVFW